MCHGEDRAGTPAGAFARRPSARRSAMTQLRRTILFGNGRMPPIGHIEERADRRYSCVSRRRCHSAGRNDVPAVMPEGPVVASGGAPRRRRRRCRREAWRVIRRVSPRRRCATTPTTAWVIPISWGRRGRRSWRTTSIAASSSGRKPLGQDLDATKAGGKDTGVPRGSQRQGMIVTSTGIVFSTARDGVLYAFDAENGNVLWSSKLPMATEGLPSIYEVEGRHYIVVNATTPHTWGLNHAVERHRLGRATGEGRVRGVCIAGEGEACVEASSRLRWSFERPSSPPRYPLSSSGPPARRAGLAADPRSTRTAQPPFGSGSTQAAPL